MKKYFIPLLAILFLTFISCADKTPLSEENKDFAGKWFANDGTWIQIYNNGGGSFELSNSSVDGGATTITDSTVVIGLFGIDATFEINEKPYEEDGQWYMELDGNLYYKNNY
ncbi:MAG: hypothetical protein ACPG4Z_05820 [Chitinophagales bacterium]